jgi:phospholipid transport system substrate-binding protein
MIKKLRALLLVAVIGLAPGMARAADAADPASFIDGLVAGALQTLRNPALPEAEREARLGAMLTRNFDLPRIARYVLGRYWTTASDDERRSFARLFEQRVVRSYAARLGQYTSETVKVTGMRPESDTAAVVTSQIVHPSGPPTRVEWRVRREDDGYRVIDIDVEGVSLALTEREQISATIQRNGGTVASLNRTLEAKLRGDTASAER